MASGAFPPAPFEPSPDFRAWLERLIGNALPPKQPTAPETDPDE